jgi:hypothetical protein
MVRISITPPNLSLHELHGRGFSDVPLLTVIHPTSWKANSRKVAFRILHMRRHGDTFLSNEAGMRCEGDHNFWWPRIETHGYECAVRGHGYGLSACVGVPIGVVRAGRSSGPYTELLVYAANGRLLKRRRRDSNPRYPVERYNTLAGCRLQPLGHSSGSQEYIKDVLRLRAFVSDHSPTLLCSWALRR